MNAPNPNDHSDWFQLWFDRYYPLVYSHRDESEAAAFAAHWPIWKHIPKDSWGLDIGCGGGRYTRILAGRGLRMVGLDLSPFLLQEAQLGNNNGSLHRSKPKVKSPNPQNPNHPLFIRGDMRKLPVKRKFHIAVCLFTSFGYFASDNEHLLALKEVSRILHPQGWFILDIPQREALESIVLSNPRSMRRIRGWTIEESRAMHGHRVVKSIVIKNQQESRNYQESVRLYSFNEAKDILNQAGFTDLPFIWGDYSGSELKVGCERMIFFCRK